MCKAIKTYLILFLSVAIFVAAGYSTYRAVHSSLFLIRGVEISVPEVSKVPVGVQTIQQLAAIPVGVANLFELDLKEVEKRILKNPWIREVRLYKRLPQTLAISVIFREPCAVLQMPKGTLAYVDSDGTVFGGLNLVFNSDLPVFLGFGEASDSARMMDALRFLQTWMQARVSTVPTQVSSISWDSDHGFRVLVTYPLYHEKKTARAIIEWGQKIGDSSGDALRNLSEVFRYLAQNSMDASRILMWGAKKIVVKTARGS